MRPHRHKHATILRHVGDCFCAIIALNWSAIHPNEAETGLHAARQEVSVPDFHTAASKRLDFNDPITYQEAHEIVQKQTRYNSETC